MDGKEINKFHALQLFTDTFAAETVHLTNEAIGIYIRLLCFAWTKNAKPFTRISAERICQCVDDKCKNTVDDILNEFFKFNKKKYGASTSDAYVILGVTEDMSFKDIKVAYQRKRKEFHPDTLLSKGLPEELLEKAKEKFIEIQSAFEEIEKVKNK